MILDKHHSWELNLPTLLVSRFLKSPFLSFVVLVESSSSKECVANLFSFHILEKTKNTLFKGAKVTSPLSMYIAEVN